MSQALPRRHPLILSATLGAVLILLIAGYMAVSTLAAHAADTLLSQGKPATASSSESADFSAAKAVDGDTGTRWSSTFSDPQWLQVDLGATAAISRVVLNWEPAYAKSFQIQVSGNGTTWTNVYSTTTGAGGVQTLTVTGSGRYVRLNGTARATAYGYSLWEFQVYGAIGSTPVGCGAGDSARGHTATASSTENATTPASAAVDGNAGTRWASAFADPQWLQVDLGTSQSICGVELSWEAAYAKSFQIQLSANGSTWTNVYSTTTGTGGNQVLTVSGTGRYVRMNGTVRATAYGYSLWSFVVHTTGSVTDEPTTAPPTTRPPTSPPPSGGSTMPDSFWGDTSGIPAAQNVVELKILNRTNGKYPDSQVFWSYNGVAHSIAEQPYFDMPANTAGRMYFYLGTPNSQYFDFIEFTVGPGVFNGNTTRVDAFGLKIAMRLHSHDGNDVQVGEDYQTFTEDRAVTFQKFSDETPTEFKHLATATAPYRIMAPGSDAAFRQGGQYQNYMSSYAAQNGVTAITSDIFGCAGVLAGDPQRCAALNRHTIDLPQSQWETVSNYYRAAPANYYAKFWHDHALGAKAYGFPYDDVAGQSSFVSHQNPQYLLVAVGW
jgi:F5/8 type C domain/Beta-1,3-glucanase